MENWFSVFVGMKGNHIKLVFLVCIAEGGGEAEGLW